MNRTWVHVGRVWPNGEPLLVAVLRVAAAFHIGAGTGVLVGDGVVRDDSRLEVFAAPDGAFAVVRAGGADYPATLCAALAAPEDGDTGDPTHGGASSPSREGNASRSTRARRRLAVQAWVQGCRRPGTRSHAPTAARNAVRAQARPSRLTSGVGRRLADTAADQRAGDRRGDVGTVAA